jgi:hypothetical protein
VCSRATHRPGLSSHAWIVPGLAQISPTARVGPTGRLTADIHAGGPETVESLASPAAALAFDLVLGLCLGGRLPLHVARGVLAAAGERHDVVDDVARTAMRIAGLAHGGGLVGGAALHTCLVAEDLAFDFFVDALCVPPFAWVDFVWVVPVRA